MKVAEFFDELYSVHERYWWRSKDRLTADPSAYPHSLLTQLTLRLLAGRRPGRALDLGAGEGADAIRLALLGYLVDAFDVSDVAIAKISKFAADAGVSIRAQVGDVGNPGEVAPDGHYDVVLAKGLLHYVRDKVTAIRLMQDATAPGGINVISLWSNYSPVPEPHTKVPVYCDDEDGEVTKWYQDWDIELHYFDREKVENAHSDMPPHRHSHIKLIARKPKPSENLGNTGTTYASIRSSTPE